VAQDREHQTKVSIEPLSVTAKLSSGGIDLDPPVVEEVDKTVPPREGIVDCLGKLGLLAD
jgi:hypothetical protein